MGSNELLIEDHQRREFRDAAGGDIGERANDVQWLIEPVITGYCDTGKLLIVIDAPVGGQQCEHWPPRIQQDRQAQPPDRPGLGSRAPGV